MMEFTFEESRWLQVLEELTDSVSAVRFLTIMEGEDEEVFEDALLTLEQRHITLDISDLPMDPGTGETAVRLRQEQRLVEENTLMQELEETDPLRLYLEEVAATPAAGDPQLLAEEFARGREAAAQSLTNLKLGRVIELAGQMTGRGVLLMDMIQEGSLGLWQSILQYTDGDFESQCDWWIRQYLAKAVVAQARSAGVGQKLRQGMQDYVDVDNRLLSELGRNPTTEEIAEELHITVQEALVLESTLQAARAKSRMEISREPEEDASEEEQAVEDTAYFQSRQRIMEMLSTLTQQEAKLLTLRFGLEGGLPLTPQQTGEKLGLTPQEVVQLEATALAKLRKQ